MELYGKAFLTELYILRLKTAVVILPMRMACVFNIAAFSVVFAPPKMSSTYDSRANFQLTLVVNYLLKAVHQFST